MRLLVLLAFALSCAKSGTFKDWEFRSPTVRYKVGELPKSWTWVGVDGGQISFLDPITQATLSADAGCDRPDAPLSVLTGHLLIGITERRILSQETFTFAAREALRTRVVGKLDGVPVELEIVLVKKDGCVYDLVYSAPPDAFAERYGDFQAFVAGFRKVPLNEGAR